MRTILGIVLAVLVGGLTGPLARAQKVPDVRLNTDPPGSALSLTPQVAAQGNAVYVVWIDDRNGYPHSDIYFNRSLDGGATWLAQDVRLDTGDPPGQSNSITPGIAASGSSVYVVWQDERAGVSNPDIYFNRSLDQGTTWLPTAIRVDHAPLGVQAWAPAMTAVGSAVYVAWMDFRINNGPNIYFTRSLDAGTTWSSPDVLLNTPWRGDNPRIAASGSSVYVVWEDWRWGGGSQPGDIYANRSLDQGATWLETDVRVDTGKPPGSAFSYNLAMAASGSQVYAAWTDNRNGSPTDIYFNRSLDGGATWMTPDVRLNTGAAPGTAYADRAEIAASGSSVYVVWSDRRGGTFIDVFLNRSLDAGATWLSPDVRLVTGFPLGTHSAGAVRVAASGSSVRVAWQDSRSGKNQVYANHSEDAGLTWLPVDVRMNTGVPSGHASAGSCRIACEPGGNVYVGWVDMRNNWWNSDIYFNIPFGNQPYGAGKAGTAGVVPGLAGTGAPVIGGSFSVDVTGGVGGAVGSLFLGLAGPASVPMLGGTLLVQPPFFPVMLVLGGTPGAAGAGSATLPLAVPFNPSLLGLRLDFQAMLLDPGASSGVSMTNGVEVWIG